MTDIWRTIEPNTRHYTWRSADTKIQCRLDYFLISQSLHGFVTNAEITPGFKTDHSVVQLSWTKGSQPRGRGFWKFNTSLLIDYVNLIKSEINPVPYAPVRFLKMSHQRNYNCIFIYEIKEKTKARKITPGGNLEFGKVTSSVFKVRYTKVVGQKK